MIDYIKADANKQGLKNYDPRLVKADDSELTPHSADVVFFYDTLHHLDERVAYLRKLAPLRLLSARRRRSRRRERFGPSTRPPSAAPAAARESAAAATAVVVSVDSKKISYQRS